MKYESIKKAVFLKRPNRFCAEILIDGEVETVHVKNTGRCREILVEGAEVFLAEGKGEKRKTKYDLVSVYKGGRLINIDSQAPNKAAGEWFSSGKSPFGTVEVKAERTFGASRLDFLLEKDGRRIFVEVKGVTLENDGVVSFPDAPTERGTKHLRELMGALAQGYEAYVLFVVQMKNVKYFTPNIEHDPVFSAELIKAENSGVKILAYDCFVSENEMRIEDKVEIRL
ncbi:MAG: DNA/RNA nuclease SfsA [Clostridiales bacterium]|nr:DNA/RNA nuclease SfsA [Clostridiales bacterium]